MLAFSQPRQSNQRNVLCVFIPFSVSLPHCDLVEKVNSFCCGREEKSSEMYTLFALDIYYIVIQKSKQTHTHTHSTKRKYKYNVNVLN